MSVIVSDSHNIDNRFCFVHLRDYNVVGIGFNNGCGFVKEYMAYWDKACKEKNVRFSVHRHYYWNIEGESINIFKCSVV